MSEEEKKNLAASVHRRLLNKANKENRPFNELLQYYAMERFLFRLSKSRYSRKFILKGALMVLAWEAPISRPTADIDFLSITDNDVENVVSIIRGISIVDVIPDGLVFNPDSVNAETIIDIAEYSGVRARVQAYLGPAHANIQLDIGFGDPVVPGPEEFDYPVLLDLPAPRLKGYSRESVISEKLESIARFGMLNSRFKDFYDIWLLSRKFDFNGATLGAAIEATFSNRERPVDENLCEDIKRYADNETKNRQWSSFIETTRLIPEPPGLVETVESIVVFIEPIIKAITSRKSYRGHWKPAGPWS